ncbi:MAG: hypothetical protein RSE04_06025 [Hydrogenoanaerobacterium sp.]
MATDKKVISFDESVEETTETTSFLSLEDILGRDIEVLKAVQEGDFETDKLGKVPFKALTYAEYKQAKKDCIKFTPDPSGGVKTEIDDDRLMVKIVILAVDKDTRSNLTFANKALLEKLEVATAEAVVGVLLSPGEIVNFAVKIQNASGFGAKKKKEDSETIKNS